MLKKKSKKILSVFFINFLLTLLVVLIAELIFGNWIFGPKYSVLNIPRNENRRFDVSKMMGPTTISYTRDKHGLRGDYSGDPKSIDVLVIVAPSDNAVMFAAAPPVSETPPLAVSNFFVPS